MKNWISNLFLGWFGPSFIGKHVTTLVGIVIGLLTPYAVAAGVSVQSLEDLKSVLISILLPVALYLLSLFKDGKPEVPKIVKK